MKGTIIFLLLIASEMAVCQTETFDIMTFSTPKNWKKESKPGVLSLYDINEKAGTFCVITMYASGASTGNADNDFKKEWKELVTTPYKIADNPKTQTETNSEGWKVVSAAAPIKHDGIESYVILTIFTGFGRSVSILSNLNDQVYVAQIDELLQQLKLEKNGDTNSLATGPSNTQSAATNTFGHMIFTSPGDWTYKKYSNGVIMKPTDLSPEHYFELWILKSKSFTGSLEQAMAESWNDALKQLQAVPAYTGTLYEITTQQTSYKGWEYIRSRGAVKKDPSSSDRYDLFLFVIKLNNRIERFALIGLINIDMGSFSPYANPAYQDDVDEIIFNSKFDDWKEPAIQNGDLKGGKISGQYAGLKLGGGMLQGSYALFFSNGQVYFREKFPTYGFDGRNTLIEAENNTRNWGTYSIQNGKGYMQFGYGKIPIQVTGNELMITTQNTLHSYIQVPSVDGIVLNGVYAFKDWKDNSPTVTFTADGKFTDNGAVDILNHMTTDPFDNSKNPGSGTYLVRNFTMIFNYSDGRKVQIAFPGLNYDRKNTSPSTLTLSFNNDEMIRK